MQVIETSKRKLGAASTSSLAFTWKEQGRTGEAISLIKQFVQLRLQMFKANHPDLLSSLVFLEQ